MHLCNQTGSNRNDSAKLWTDTVGKEVYKSLEFANEDAKKVGIVGIMRPTILDILARRLQHLNILLGAMLLLLQQQQVLPAVHKLIQPMRRILELLLHLMNHQ